MASGDGTGSAISKSTEPRTLRSLEDLRAAPYNPRTIEPAAARGLAASLETFGDLSGIVWNARTGHLVAGHQRVDQLRKLGAVLEVGEDGAGLAHGDRWWPIRIVEWDDATEKAANVTANNPKIAGEFSEAIGPLLAEVALSFPTETFDAVGLGDLAATKGGKPGRTSDDDLPDMPDRTIVRRGDLWLLGSHRVLCGDSTKPEDVARLMGSERAGLMNTDPPYGVAYTNDDRPNPGVAKARVAKARVAKDTLTDGELQAFLESAFRPAIGHALRENAAWYLWHAHLTQGFFAAAAAAADVMLHRQIIWVKPALLLTRGQYHWRHEPAFMGWVKGHRPPDYGRGAGERDQTSVWAIPSVPREDLHALLGLAPEHDQSTVWEIAGVRPGERALWKHSTPKPVALFEIPIVKHLRVGEVAFEPFAGSGPQVIAAEKLARRCFAIELMPVFVEVIVRRWEAFTGKTARLDGTGETLDDLAKTREAL